MSMHLEGPWLSTTGKKKGKKKWPSAEAKRRAEELEKSWTSILKKHQIDQQERKKINALSSPAWQPKKSLTRETAMIPSLPFSGGPCLKAEQKIYTGTKIKGIGTMHKSNAVPIFSEDEAKDIASMRR